MGLGTSMALTTPLSSSFFIVGKFYTNYVPHTANLLDSPMLANLGVRKGKIGTCAWLVNKPLRYSQNVKFKLSSLHVFC